MNLHPQDTTAQEVGKTRSRIRGPQAAPPAERSGEEDEISFANLISTAWASKWTILGVAILITALAVFYVWHATRLYTATASLVLETQQQDLLALENALPGFSSDDEALNTEVLVLRSRSLLGQVADELSLQEDPEFNPSLRPIPIWKEWVGYNDMMNALGRSAAPPTPEKVRKTAIEILREQKLSISIVPKTFAIEIAIETQSREKSSRIANTIAQRYIEGQRTAKFTSMDDAMVWLGQRVAELKGELEAAEGKVRDYAAESTAISEERLVLETEKLKRLRDELENRRKGLEDLQNRVQELETLHAQDEFKAVSQVARDPQLAALADGLATGAADNVARSRFDALLDQRIREMRAQIQREKREINTLRDGIRVAESQVRQQSSDFVKFQQLQREAEATRLIYEYSLGRMKEISLQRGIQQADARVLDPAITPDEPSHPKPVQTVFAGGIFGALLGLLVVFMRDALRTSFQSREELEEFARLPVIGTIPEAGVRRPQGILSQIVEKPMSPVAEALRNLRTAIDLSNLDQTPQVVMLTSSVPGEGKSTVAAGLAEAAALSGKRVLLVDGDLRRRTLKNYFRIDTEIGLLAVLSDKVSLGDAVYRHDATNMDILVADEGNVTAGDMFGSQKFAAFIDEARKTYDLIVLDTPPILAVSDTRMIAQQIDALIYVVRWNSTPRRAMRAGLEVLRQSNVMVTGAVLNRIKSSGSDHYGYYGYG